MTITIDPDALEQAVRDIAAENPDFVYVAPGDDDTCVYVDENGCPSCIIGQAAARIGVPIATLQSWDSGESGAPSINIGSILRDAYGMDDHRAFWFATVQWRQDKGGRWGMAVSIADAETGRTGAK
ncbi:hypothetical protein AB0E01_22650 [Nocardia vinacea]|uniref:hypothetical protein n=1 Tax=Nocardia vinacea TaxID=96468 RepID=UPI0033EB02BA